jgi:prolipoprotein diacylglyceryltransferase
LLICGVLLLVHPIRNREGQLFALALVLYPIVRILEEAIRSDNPWAVTHNQYTSLVLLAVGLAMLLALRRLPASAGAVLAQRLSESPRRDLGRNRN